MESPCPCCGEAMRRSRRTLAERVLFAQAQCCTKCATRCRLSRWRSLRDSRYVSCPRCAGQNLRVFSRIDRIEGMQRNPLRWIERLLGAPLYYCAACRLQFFDVRPLLRGTMKSGRKPRTGKSAA